MKIKILLWSVVLIIGFAAALILLKPQSQTITLPDGTALTLEKVTSGKRPNLHEWDGSFYENDNTNSTLNIWLRRQYPPGKRAADYHFVLVGESGYATEPTWNMFHSIGSRQSSRNFFLNIIYQIWNKFHPAPNNQDTEFISFGSFPRRDANLSLQVRQWPDSPTAEEFTEEVTNREYWKKTVKGEFTFQNPAHGPFQNWQPQPLPVTQHDGDLEVTLTKLLFGVSEHRGGELHASDPDDRAVLAAFLIKQNGSVATNWQPGHIDEWDATGNHAVNNIWGNNRRDGEEMMIYQWGLPPDEPAWKLRAEFSRTSGFSDDELLTFTNVPIVTNKVFHVDQSADISDAFVKKKNAGTTIYIFSVRQSEDPDDHGKEQLRFQIQPPPEGLRLTLLKVTDERGREIKCSLWNWGVSAYNYALDNPGDAKSITVTLALHRSRYAEFIVKPEKATAATTP